MLVWLLGGCLVVMLVVVVVAGLNREKRSKLPPGSVSLLDGLESVFWASREYTSKRYEKYGKVFKCRLFFRPTIYLLGPEANKIVLTGEEKGLMVTEWPESTRFLLGDSLSNKIGAIHKQQRKLLSKAFTPTALENYFPHIVRITEKYLKRWETIGNNFELYPEIKKYAFEIASVLLIGEDFGKETERLSQLFGIYVNGLFSLPLNLPFTSFGKAVKARDEICLFLDSVIAKRKAEQDEHHKVDGISLMMQAQDEEGNLLSHESLKDQVLLQLFAGHDTTSSGLTSICMLLAQQPEIIEKARQEINSVLEGDAPENLEQLKKLPYADQVIKEVLRVYPPVGGSFRKVVEDFEYEGYHIPKDWFIAWSAPISHEDENAFADAKKFNPDRFGNERSEDRKTPWTFLPFGGGSRMCLGYPLANLEMKIFFVMLVKSYSWKLACEKPEMQFFPIPLPKDNLKIRSFNRID